MTFPWKKVKSKRISKLVNDHLHNSQKRRDGSSLVVETGFPTSLIDLFIKNREKLKNSSKKKREISPFVPLNDVNDPFIAGSPTHFPSPLQSPSPKYSPVIAGLPTTPLHLPFHSSSPLQSESLLPLPLPLASRSVNEIVVGERDGAIGVDGAEKNSGVDANGVILAVVKIFLVVVLALWTKRLTVGFTMSAFLLFFLEHVGKHLCGLLNPCSKAKGCLRLMLQKVLKMLRYKEDKLDQKNGGVPMLKVRQEEFLKPDCSSLKRPGSRCLIQETEIVEPKTEIIDDSSGRSGYREIQPEMEIIEDFSFKGRSGYREIQPEMEIIEDFSFKGRSGYREIDSKEVVMEEEKSMCEVAESGRKSRKAKIKSKMKIFVPKKLRNLRKENNLERLKIIREDFVAVCEEQVVDECGDEVESESASRLSSTSSGRFKDEDGMSAIYAFGEFSEVAEEAATNKEEGGVETESGLSWRYFVLCLTVLIGLIGGRAFALVFTLSLFLLLKLGKTLPRYINVHVIWSFDDKFG